MSLGQPGASAAFTSGQARQEWSPYWGVYASIATLPNAAGNILSATQFKLEQGDIAFVSGVGTCTCISPGAAGAGNAVWTPGNVSGPTSSTDNAIARWDGTSGKLLQDSVVVVTDPGVIQPSTAGAGLSAGGTITTQNTPAFTLLNSGSFTGAAGTTQVQTRVAATINQSATAAFTLLELSRAETALGSGAQWFTTALGGAGGATQVFGITSTGTGRFPTGSAALMGVEIGGFTYGNLMGIWRSGNTTLTFAQAGVNFMTLDVNGTLGFDQAGFALRMNVGNQPLSIGSNVQAASTAVLFVNNLSLLTSTAAQFGVIEFYGLNQSGAGSFVGHQIRMGANTSGAGGAPVVGSAGAWHYEGLVNNATMFSVSLNGAIATTAVSPAMLAAGVTQDYAGFGVYGFGRVTPDNVAGTSALGGILATNIRDGHELTLVNIGTVGAIPAQNLTINHLDAGSAAANQIITSTAAAIVLAANDTVTFKYDLTSAKWRQITAVA